MLGVKQQFFIKVLIGVVCVVIWLSYSISLFLPKATPKTNEIAISQELSNSGAKWEVVNGGLLKDIRRIAFDKDGRKGVAISLEGHLIKSENGGLTWDSFGKMPFVDENGNLSSNENENPGIELVNALSITDKGIFIGTAVDNSTYGAIYQLENKGKWKVQVGNYGGLLNSTSTNDTPVMIGSNGLMVSLLSNKAISSTPSTTKSTARQNVTTSQINKIDENRINDQDITFNQLPLWAQINLYSIDKKANDLVNDLVVAGDYGLVCKSNDGAKSWKNISPSKTNKLPFYAIAIGKDMILAGGSNGSFWRFDEKTSSWLKITGLKTELTIFAIYSDKEGNSIVGGGEQIGTSPFILFSSDNGLSWHYELIPQSFGRITSISKSSNGIFVSTLDGHILLRKNTTSP